MSAVDRHRISRIKRKSAYLRPRPGLPHRTHNVSTVLHVVRLDELRSRCTVALVERQLVLQRSTHFARHSAGLQAGTSASARTRRPRSGRVAERHGGRTDATQPTSSLTWVRRWQRTSVVLPLSRHVLTHRHAPASTEYVIIITFITAS